MFELIVKVVFLEKYEEEDAVGSPKTWDGRPKTEDGRPKSEVGSMSKLVVMTLFSTRRDLFKIGFWIGAKRKSA